MLFPMILALFGLGFGRPASARDLVVLVAPRPAVAIEVGRTKRIHRALARLHPDAEVLTLDPVLAFHPGEGERDRAAMRERLAWELTLRQGRVRTLVFATDVVFDDDRIFLPPFGTASAVGPDRDLMAALGPLVDRLAPGARIVFLAPEALAGRLSRVETLSRAFATFLGAPKALVFGATTDVRWPLPEFFLLRAYLVRRLFEDDWNRGRRFEFGADLARSRYLRFGVDDAEIFGCAAGLESGD